MPFKSPNKVFEELLVMRCQAGDHKALELLVKRWNPRIMRYALRNIKDQQGSEDVAQEVWIVVIKSLYRLSEHAKFGNWILGITHNKSMDWIKKNPKLEEHQLITEPSSSDEPVHNNLIIRMRKAIQKLNTNQRNILTLFYLEGYSLNEISDILSISKGTVKSRLYYARESLKKQINIYNHG